MTKDALANRRLEVVWATEQQSTKKKPTPSRRESVLISHKLITKLYGEKELLQVESRKSSSSRNRVIPPIIMS